MVERIIVEEWMEIFGSNSQPVMLFRKEMVI